ncbi:MULTISPECIES: hypothetical protein [Pseudonocardia]|uniref:hypothetical protein n=1 Tax=Pseudonocardia TaxID=1847 RepID=UPI001AD7D249|nr:MULTISPECIES: hypothetical protein [Pseudonocardia]MBO4241521.1 hypothetical protein [Pseudonocardia alni]
MERHRERSEAQAVETVRAVLLGVLVAGVVLTLVWAVRAGLDVVHPWWSFRTGFPLPVAGAVALVVVLVVLLRARRRGI